RRLASATLLAALVVAVPAIAAPSDQPQQSTKQKEIQALEKQLADLQAKLAALKNGKTETVAAPSAKMAEGTIPDKILEQFAWRCIGPANMGGRITSIAVNEADPTNYYIATASGGL